MSIIELGSFIAGRWVAPQGARRAIASAVTGETVAETGSAAPDTQALLAHARERGGPALRAMTFHERARMLKAVALHLKEHRDRLYALNAMTGATRRDGAIDIDGGITTMLVMASKGRRELPDGHVCLDGEVEELSRKGSFKGIHVCTPLQGVTVHINAFNFPVWGMLEKLAPAWLAGVPAIVKPATSTAYLTEAAVRLILESGLVPEGALQFIAGGTGDLLERLGAQDVVAFTGSADTALMLRGQPALLRNSVRFMAEQDSLNAAILGPDAVAGTPEFDLFVAEVLREMTIKAGQKCTATRRLIVPQAQMAAVAEALAAGLAKVRIGDPAREDVKMGALVSLAQREDVLAKAAAIGQEARLVCGDQAGLRPEGADGATGAFVAPMLFACDDPDAARVVHEVEAFGPVSTLLPYRDTAHAAALANRGGGSLVASLFTHDPSVARQVALVSAAWHGRLYIADRDSAGEATGHGTPLPHLVHGGPGRAGGGEELGGVRGVMHYMQRSAVQGSPAMLSAVSGQWLRGAPEVAPPAHPFRLDYHSLQIGHTLWTPAREVTPEDIAHFADFTGDTFYAHTDAEAAAANPFFPGIVAHGYLLLSFAAGLFVEPAPGPVLANTGLGALAFQKPVSPGDSIRVRLTVKRKTGRTETYGEVCWDVALFNQDDEQVASYDLLTMVAYAAP